MLSCASPHISVPRETANSSARSDTLISASTDWRCPTVPAGVVPFIVNPMQIGRHIFPSAARFFRTNSAQTSGRRLSGSSVAVYHRAGTTKQNFYLPYAAFWTHRATVRSAAHHPSPQTHLCLSWQWVWRGHGRPHSRLQEVSCSLPLRPPLLKPPCCPPSRVSVESSLKCPRRWMQ